MADDVMSIDLRELRRVQREVEQKIEATHGSEMLMAMRTATGPLERILCSIASVPSMSSSGAKMRLTTPTRYASSAVK